MIKSLKLMEKYGTCPQCGESRVGNGAGKLIIEDAAFYRECKCGWKITTNEDGQEINQ